MQSNISFMSEGVLRSPSNSLTLKLRLSMRTISCNTSRCFDTRSVSGRISFFAKSSSIAGFIGGIG